MPKIDKKISKMLGLNGKIGTGTLPKESGFTQRVQSGFGATTQAVGGVEPKDTSEIMYPNAGLVDLYADEKGFKINDNSKLYEVVKVVKDIIDFNFYVKGMSTISFQFGINVNTNSAVFTITFNDNQAQTPDSVEPLDFAESLADKITFEIQKKFFNTVDVERNINPLVTAGDGFNGGDSKTELVLIAREKTVTGSEE